MPAAELSRLREQIARLLALFGQPDEFVRTLRNICEIYEDVSFRPGKETGPPFIPSYRLPPLVQRQLEVDLAAASIAHPAPALGIVDVLWAEPRLEPRKLAALMLGRIPLSQADEILRRLRQWATPSEDRQMIEILLDSGTARLRIEGFDALLEIYAEWLGDPDPGKRAIGLKALSSLIRDEKFENLPPVFDLLMPLVRTATSTTFNDLATILVALARRTPAETTFFLRQVLASPYAKDTPRLVRRVLPYLSTAQQESLRTALR